MSVRERTSIGVASILFAVCLALMSTGLASAQDTIKIGVVAPYSGNFSYLGANAEQGARMAADFFNAQGGVLGKKVELIIEDNQTNPGITTQKMMKLIEKDKVNFVLVGGGTSSAISAFEIAKREKVLTFSVDANDNSLNMEKANRYTFRVPEPNYELVKAVAPSILEKYGKKWYFHTPDYKWGWDMSGTLKNFLKSKGGTSAGEDLIPMEARDFSTYVINVRNAKPDVLIVMMGGAVGIAAQTQYNEFGLAKTVKRTAPLFDHDTWLILGYEKAKDNGVFIVEWDFNIGAPGCKEFYEDWKKKFPASFVPIPMLDTYHAYIGAREALRVMAEQKTVNTQEVIKGLEGRVVKDSLTHNPAMFREWDHQYVRDAYIFTFKEPKEVRFAGDWVKPIQRVPWQDLYRTKEENPIRLNQEAF